MSRIISLTGPSGAGKTTLARALIEAIPNTAMVESITTRTPRISDISGEYRYIDATEFSGRASRGTFIWQTTFAGNRYGTEKNAVHQVFERQGRVGVMILLPSVISLLMSYLHSFGKANRYTPVYILPPPRSVLYGRLLARGDMAKSIDLRLAEAATWESEARKSGIDYKFIDNSGSVDDAKARLLALLV